MKTPQERMEELALQGHIITPVSKEEGVQAPWMNFWDPPEPWKIISIQAPCAVARRTFNYIFGYNIDTENESSDHAPFPPIVVNKEYSLLCIKAADVPEQCRHTWLLPETTPFDPSEIMRHLQHNILKGFGISSKDLPQVESAYFETIEKYYKEHCNKSP